jgi:hypothetical protein
MKTSNLAKYEGISKSFWTESIMKYMLTTINTHSETMQSTHSETMQRVMAAKLTRLTHKIVIQLHLVAESCTICSSCSRQPVWKLLDTPSYIWLCFCVHILSGITVLMTA